jgi:hypothetical protein
VSSGQRAVATSADVSHCPGASSSLMLIIYSRWILWCLRELLLYGPVKKCAMLLDFTQIRYTTLRTNGLII